MIANAMCLSCLFAKQEKLVSGTGDEEKKREFLRLIRALLDENGQTRSAPWLAEQAAAIYERFWPKQDYGPLKHRYNQLMLRWEQDIDRRIQAAADPLRECVKYVCAGNYIDFSAVEDVSVETLSSLMKRATETGIPEDEYRHFLHDLAAAESLVYLTDNCGEIVLDKLFIRCILARFPRLPVHVILRGRDVLNDATLTDAEETGLTALVPCVGNGNAAPGTVLDRLSPEARHLLTSAGLIIAKGQGNFESLYGEGLDPYYFFLCKCDLFVRRFGLARYSTVFARETRLTPAF